MAIYDTIETLSLRPADDILAPDLDGVRESLNPLLSTAGESVRAAMAAQGCAPVPAPACAVPTCAVRS